MLQLAALALRAFAWRNVLAAAYPARAIPVFSLACAYAAGVGLNAYLPARGGEAAKVALARAQIPGSSIATVAASLSVVMVLDAVLGASLILGLWATGVLPALPSLPGHGFVWIVAGVAVASVGAAGLLAHRFAAASRRVLSSAVRGLTVLRSPWRYVTTVVPFQLAAWACRVGVVYCALEAFRFDVGVATALLVVVLNGASAAVPVPGGAGSQQVLAAYALQGAVSTAAALSFSVSMQIGVTAVNTTIGLIALMVLFRTVRPLGAARAAVRARF
jgi:Lysylphosphatidylglycerol synthase TM region